jgi:transposase-like protein
MKAIARKSDGRRIFTEAFKQEQIDRVLRGEVTVADLSRKLGIARSLLQRWKRHTRQDGSQGPMAKERSTPASMVGPAQYLRELQLLIGKQAVELELLRAEIGALKNERTFLREELNTLEKEQRSKRATHSQRQA